MNPIEQTPVAIGPIPVDVIRVPETDNTAVLVVIAMLLFWCLGELRQIVKNTRREP